ncbi:porin family protein [Pontibacter beigongshangensis]|uniref:porin family protein n=1 Tax=Pontibacter beigongshangensis TaxID=2574733 RepID=UPI001F50A931|nr:porin family protein [Pontibacter beigongshangensis]
MKKLSLVLMFLCFGLSASAQIEIGVQLSPNIAGNRFVAEDAYNFRNSNNLRFGVGVIADYFFSQNYAISTGLFYRTKGGKITYTHNSGTVSTSGSDNVSIQYLQLPVTLKLFTNEIAPGTILYVQVGTALNTKVSAEVNDKKIINNEKMIKRFNIFEIDALLGTGVEFTLGQSTKLLAGVSYHRGLSDIDDYYEKLFSDRNISVKNNVINLDFGVKF